ncbi:MAG: hypothetical protein WBM53_12645, partial [Maribacter sp.]
MIHSQPLLRIRSAVLLAIVGILVFSCGSYQQASYYDNDGIYEEDNVRVVEKAPQQVRQKKENNAYSDYFGQKADEYGEILDSEVFTDIDSYASKVENDSLVNEGDLLDYYNTENDYEGYGGWGDNATDVSINIYGGGGYGFGYYNPWFINSWNYWGYGGYYNPWRWNNWGFGYGYGYGYYNPWYSPYYYGYGYGGYYNRYYGNRY